MSHTLLASTDTATSLWTTLGGPGGPGRTGGVKKTPPASGEVGGWGRGRNQWHPARRARRPGPRAAWTADPEIGHLGDDPDRRGTPPAQAGSTAAAKPSARSRWILCGFLPESTHFARPIPGIRGNHATAAPARSRR